MQDPLSTASKCNLVDIVGVIRSTRSYHSPYGYFIKSCMLHMYLPTPNTPISRSFTMRRFCQIFHAPHSFSRTNYLIIIFSFEGLNNTPVQLSQNAFEPVGTFSAATSENHLYSLHASPCMRMQSNAKISKSEVRFRLSTRVFRS